MPELVAPEPVTTTLRWSTPEHKKMVAARFAEAKKMVSSEYSIPYATNYQAFHWFCVCFGTENLKKLISELGIRETTALVVAGKNIPDWALNNLKTKKGEFDDKIRT